MLLLCLEAYFNPFEIQRKNVKKEKTIKTHENTILKNLKKRKNLKFEIPLLLCQCWNFSEVDRGLDQMLDPCLGRQHRF